MELLLHIGFPKTATTSLQENLFVDLHNLGKIEFLGYAKFKNAVSVDNKFGLRARYNYLRGNGKLFGVVDALKEGKLNVISDEVVTLSKYFIELKYEVNRTSLGFFEQLFQKLNSKVNVRILVTLRNQPDLLFSQFVQMYHYIYHKKNKPNFSDFLIFFENNKELFETFYFNTYFRMLKEIIGDTKIEFLFFEDLTNDRREYVSNLGNILNTDPEVINNALFREEFRKREKEKEFSFTKVPLPKKRWLGGLVKYKFSARGIFEKIGNLFFEKKQVKIPVPAKLERDRIFEQFKFENELFFEYWNLNKDKGKLYGYF